MFCLCLLMGRNSSPTQIPKLDKDTYKKKKKETKDQLPQKKIFKSSIKQYNKKITHHDQVDFIPGMQGLFNIHKPVSVIQYINRLNYRNHVIILVMQKRPSANIPL